MSNPSSAVSPTLPKAPTGIQGLDEVTGGGLPRGRPTLVCGTAGCGKTLFAMEFLVRGAIDFNEPGVFMAFEETAEELSQNVRSLGFDLDQMVAQKQLSLDYVHVEPEEIQETGEYDLDGLFVRLGLAIDEIGAKRVVLDTIETLFGGLSNAAILRGELRRLFRWLKDRHVTCVITGERGDGSLTRQGLEEYVSDCVILLDHRVSAQTSTRRLRIVKYRGSVHGTNEYPFLIEENGISVLPVTSLGLQHSVTDERISSGIDGLDAMLDGCGYYRGSSILLSGTAGTGKTSLAAHFARAACKRAERCLYLSFEESPAQIIRNMLTIGVDLAPFVASGLLRINSTRPNLYGLESHLATIHKLVNDFRPQNVIVDPISNMDGGDDSGEAYSMLLRLVDFLKEQKITSFLVNLTNGGEALEQTKTRISSLIDTWLLLRAVEVGGERNKVLYVLKSRGMAHSNQLREFTVSSKGIQLIEPYAGPDGVLTGSMRTAQEAREKALELARAQESSRKQREINRRRAELEAQITSLRDDLSALQEEAKHLDSEAQARDSVDTQTRLELMRRRGAAETVRDDTVGTTR